MKPKRQEDFGDGGAYPEIHIAQYPLEMGRSKTVSEFKIFVTSYCSSRLIILINPSFFGRLPMEMHFRYKLMRKGIYNMMLLLDKDILNLA